MKRSTTLSAKLGKFERGFGLGPGNFLVGRGYRVRSKLMGERAPLQTQFLPITLDLIVLQARAL